MRRSARRFLLEKADRLSFCVPFRYLLDLLKSGREIQTSCCISHFSILHLFLHTFRFWNRAVRVRIRSILKVIVFERKFTGVFALLVRTDRFPPPSLRSVRRELLKIRLLVIRGNFGGIQVEKGFLCAASVKDSNWFLFRRREEEAFPVHLLEREEKKR